MILHATVCLRHNVTLAADAELARREFEALCGAARPVTKSELAGEIGVAAARKVQSPRPPVPAAFAVRASAGHIARLLRRSAFAQEVFVRGPESSLEQLAAESRAPWASVAANDQRVFASLSYVIESESVFEDREPSRRREADLFSGVGEGLQTGRLLAVSNMLLAPFRGADFPAAMRLRKAKKTTLFLTHEIHIYKAKFFPRMVRALLNIYAAEAKTLLDPFCGSGTALLEGALLGVRSYGADLDPICAEISKAKVESFLADHTPELLLRAERLVQDQVNGHFVLPQELCSKLQNQDRKNRTRYLEEISADAGKIAATLKQFKGKSRDPLILTLGSDSLTKKVRYRFVGVGNGRYTIEVVKQRIVDRFGEKIERCVQLTHVFRELESDFGLRLGRVTATQGDARKLSSWPTAKADVIITSPPYLPASSGREHYAASRALAFAALGWNNGKHGYHDSEAKSLDARWIEKETNEAARLLAYLKSDQRPDADPQRDAMRFERKYEPTVSYLNDIRAFFRNAAAVLELHAPLLFVVATQHTFYSHRRNEVEHVCKGASLYAEIARLEGLTLEEEIVMELNKSAASRAKPRASEQYHESVLVFRCA